MEEYAEGPSQRDKRLQRLGKAALILYSPFVLAIIVYRRVSWLALAVGFLAGIMVVTLEAAMIRQRVGSWSQEQALQFQPTVRLMVVVVAAVGIILTFTIGPLIGLGLVTVPLLWFWSARQRWIGRQIVRKGNAGG